LVLKGIFRTPLNFSPVLLPVFLMRPNQVGFLFKLAFDYVPRNQSLHLGERIVHPAAANRIANFTGSAEALQCPFADLQQGGTLVVIYPHGGRVGLRCGVHFLLMLHVRENLFYLSQQQSVRIRIHGDEFHFFSVIISRDKAMERRKTNDATWYAR